MTTFVVDPEGTCSFCGTPRHPRTVVVTNAERTAYVCEVNEARSEPRVRRGY